MEQTKFKITFGKVTALLCALTILLGVIAFFGNDAAADIERINNRITEKKEEVAYQESNIVQRQVDITGYQQEKQEAEAALTEAKADLEKAASVVLAAQNAADKAESDLDAVCYRSYYSSWYCTETCKPLHTEAANKQTELKNAKNQANTLDYTVSSIEEDLEELDSKIRQAEQDIANAQTRIGEIKEEISQLKSKLAGAWAMMLLNILAMLLAVAALGLFAKSFYEENIDKFTLYAVGGMAASALLFFISSAIDNMVFEAAPLLFVLINPYTWNIAIMGLLAAVLLEKAPKPVVMRNIAVVFSVIMGVLLVTAVDSILGVLYAATAICIAFMIVPLVFTKYICIAKHIFLSLITFGIWQLVWTYHVTKNLNDVEGVEERKPARELLLCMFLPFYYPYWLYKTAEGVEDYGKVNEKEFKIDILCIAFAFVCPLFATVLIQNKINVVAGKPLPVEPVVLEEPVQVEAEPVEAE